MNSFPFVPQIHSSAGERSISHLRHAVCRRIYLQISDILFQPWLYSPFLGCGNRFGGRMSPPQFWPRHTRSGTAARAERSPELVGQLHKVPGHVTLLTPLALGQLSLHLESWSRRFFLMEYAAPPTWSLHDPEKTVGHYPKNGVIDPFLKGRGDSRKFQGLLHMYAYVAPPQQQYPGLHPKMWVVPLDPLFNNTQKGTCLNSQDLQLEEVGREKVKTTNEVPSFLAPLNSLQNKPKKGTAPQRMGVRQTCARLSPD